MDVTPDLFSRSHGYRPRMHGFSEHGWVVEHDDRKEVYVGGQLLGAFDPADPEDKPYRNMLLLTTSQDRNAHLGNLARAFGVDDEVLRRLRRRFENEGVRPLLEVRRGGIAPVRTEALKTELFNLFAQGASIDSALAAYNAGKRRKQRIGRATAGRVRKEWTQASSTSLLPIS